MRRVLKWIGGAALLLVAYFVGSTVNWFYRFDLKLNPIVSEIQANLKGEWGERSNLIPTVFDNTDTPNEIISALEGGGFLQMSEDTLWQRYAKDFQNGTLIFSRETNKFPCNQKLYVFLQFSKDQKLQSAQATTHEHGCL